MRRVIIVLILLAAIWFGYTVIEEGVSLGANYEISNYESITAASKEIDTLISTLQNLNDTEFKVQETRLTESIKNYTDKKEQYEELQALVGNTSLAEQASLVDIYDVDFLWTIIGNYATEEGISLKFDIVKSSTTAISSPDYTVCDLKFTISGDYITLTDFIYDLEDDNRLGFEISQFLLKKGGDNLEATFTVTDIPINNKNLSEITTAETPEASTGTGELPDGTTDPTAASGGETGAPVP